MSTYTSFGRWSLVTKFRLRKKFTSEIFHQRKYPDLWYTMYVHIQCVCAYTVWMQLLTLYIGVGTRGQWGRLPPQPEPSCICYTRPDNDSSLEIHKEKATKYALLTCFFTRAKNLAWLSQTIKGYSLDSANVGAVEKFSCALHLQLYLMPPQP